MFRFMIIAAIISLGACQNYHQNPQTAAILREQRYLSGDGKFGAAYTQEDGTDFKEETDADGTRHGSYSYVDPTGQRRTISYTAGKNGFQASGEHLPVAPPAPPQPVPQAGYNPQPQYQAQSSPAQSSYRSNDYDDGSYDPRFNDPAFGQQQQQHQQQQQRYQPQSYEPAPQPQFRPQPAPQPHFNPAPAPQQQFNNYQPPQQPFYYQASTTPNPHRFSPPGKLSLNRTPDGFTYSFNKI